MQCTHASAARPQPVFVEEPDIPTTVSILRGIKSKYESHHGVTITDGALVLAAKLAKRYIPSRRLPDSAIDLLDESAGANAPRSRDCTCLWSSAHVTSRHTHLASPQRTSASSWIRSPRSSTSWSASSYSLKWSRQPSRRRSRVTRRPSPASVSCAAGESSRCARVRPHHVPRAEKTKAELAECREELVRER